MATAARRKRSGRHRSPQSLAPRCASRGAGARVRRPHYFGTSAERDNGLWISRDGRGILHASRPRRWSSPHALSPRQTWRPDVRRTGPSRVAPPRPRRWRAFTAGLRYLGVDRGCPAGVESKVGENGLGKAHMADTAIDPRVTDLALRKGEVEIRKLSAEATSAEISSIVPKLPAEIPGGKLDAGDKASPYGVVAAYRALSPIAETIVGKMPAEATGVWIVPNDVVSRHRAVNEAVTAILERIQREISAAEEMLAPPPKDGAGADVRALTMLPVALSFAASAIPAVASLMRTNTIIRSQPVTVAFSALAAEVADALRARLGGSVVVSIHGAPAPVAADLIGRVREAEAARDALALALVRYRAEGIGEPPPEVAATAERLAALKLLAAECAKEKNHKEFDAVLSLVEDAARAASHERESLARRVGVSSYVDKVLSDASTALAGLLAADAQGITPLQMAAVYEANRDSHVLILESSYAGAESIYEEIPLRADRGVHLGSTVATYFLLDSTSRMLDSGVVYDVVAGNTKVGHSRLEWTNEASNQS